MMRDIPYAPGARHMLDVCRPRSAAAAPIVVFFYGGGWRSGRKEMYGYAARALARRGYLTVLPDYRIYPEVKYPDFLDDGAHAVRWARDHAAQLGGDPDKIFLMGHSAGAHIAAMLFILVAALAPILRLFVPVLRDADLFIERVLQLPHVVARAA